MLKPTSKSFLNLPEKPKPKPSSKISLTKLENSQQIEQNQPTNNSTQIIQTNQSSAEGQREIRIQKINQLRERGIEPFAVESKRDHSLGFVAFWFNFVHKFDISKLGEDEGNYILNFFLERVLFPQSLVERMEEKIHLRHTARQMGLDPDEEEGAVNQEFSPELIELARDLFENAGQKTAEQRLQFLTTFLKEPADPNTEKNEAEEVDVFEKTLEKNQIITLCGRIKSKRVSGKIAFATVEDESQPEGFQFIFKADTLINNVAEEMVNKLENENIKADLTQIANQLNFEDFKNLIDEGDYIQATGRLDYSQRGEPSLFVYEYKILSKALRLLPEKIDYDNFEYRYLNRVADLKFNTQDEKGKGIRDYLYLKSKYWSIWREEMIKEGFLEVETPILRTIPSGAEAKPFTTFYNELEQEVYLRMELELPQKKLIAGGFEKVFEIGRQFRNEGSSPQHLQEYTQIEWYCAYQDYIYGMKLTKRIYQRLVLELTGSLIQTDYYGNRINWGNWFSNQNYDVTMDILQKMEQVIELGKISSSTLDANFQNKIDEPLKWVKNQPKKSKKTIKKPNWEQIDGWPLVPYFEAVRYYSNGLVDFEGKTFDQLLRIAKKYKVEVEKNIGYAGLMDKIYKKLVRPNIINPIFLIQFPVEIEPMAKRDPKNPNFVQRFQVVAGTAELGKGFSELNDPVDQLQRFEEQQKAKDAGDQEAMAMDMDFVQALEFGTPPMAGFGTSERFFSFLFSKHIKEFVTFPAVRSQNINTTDL
jgi:lysyl-tRNA synthetase class 2